MARKIPITELAGKATMNAQPYLEGLREMDKATKGTTAGLNSTWDKFTKGFTKKWTAQRFGSQVAKGLGLASGFSILDKGADAISGQWEKAAELAKFVEDSTAKQFQLARDAMAARRTDLQQQLVLEAEIIRTQRELNGAKSAGFEFDWTEPTQWTDHFQSWLADSNLSPEMTKKVQELTTALYELGKAKSELDQKIKDSKTKLNIGWTQMLGDSTNKMFAANRALREVEYGSEMDDPKRRAELIKQYDKEMAFYRGRIAKAGMPTPENKIQLAQDQYHYAEAVEKLLPLLEREYKLANDLGSAFANSFEEAVLSGNKLSDVLRGLLQDMVRLAFRETITTPLAGFMGNFFKGIFRAEGGPVTGGQPYIVGERGPELFVPSTSGNIEPRVPSGGGGTYYIDARGADQHGLSRLEQMIRALNGSIEARAVAAQFNAQRRRYAPSPAG